MVSYLSSTSKSLWSCPSHRPIGSLELGLHCHGLLCFMPQPSRPSQTVITSAITSASHGIDNREISAINTIQSGCIELHWRSRPCALQRGMQCKLVCQFPRNATLGDMIRQGESGKSSNVCSPCCQTRRDRCNPGTPGQSTASKSSWSENLVDKLRAEHCTTAEKRGSTKRRQGRGWTNLKA